MTSRFLRGEDSDEGNCTLQNRQHFALCGSRREHIRRREILAGWRGIELGASPRRSPCLVRPSGSRTRGLLLIVCCVRSISCLAFGYAGKDNSSSNWCFGMGAFRVSTPRGLRELPRTFWSCTDSFSCTCNLHWLGSLANKTCTLNVANYQMNQWSPNRKIRTMRVALQCRPDTKHFPKSRWRLAGLYFRASETGW